MVSLVSKSKKESDESRKNPISSPIKVNVGPGGVAQLVGASSHRPKCCKSDLSPVGYIPTFQV